MVSLLIIKKKRKNLYQTIKLQHDEINEKNKELEAYHVVKDKIFSTVVHDFKTPLNSIEGMFTLLEKQNLSASDLSELSSKLKVNLATSKQSINDLIYWAKKSNVGH